jgi:hypothetical protein
MNEPRATLATTEDSPPVSVPSPAPPSLQHLAGRFLFCGVPLSAVKAIAAALGGLTVALQSFAAEANNDRALMAKAIADMREIIGPPSKRFMWRHLAYESIRTAELVSRMKPPTRPHWLILRAPWARHWGLNLPRGRRRTRSWT